MTTLTIDIPDANAPEVIAQLKKLGVMVRESKLSELDKLTKEDYQKFFANQSKRNIKKDDDLDETAYLLQNPTNAARLTKSIECYEKWKNDK